MAAEAVILEGANVEKISWQSRRGHGAECVRRAV